MVANGLDTQSKCSTSSVSEPGFSVTGKPERVAHSQSAGPQICQRIGPDIGNAFRPHISTTHRFPGRPLLVLGR